MFMSTSGPFVSDTANGDFFRLVYRSDATRRMSSEEVRALLIVARIRNLTCEISGLLIHDHGRFWQYLEGPKWAVEQVFGSIERDYRHTNITIVESGETTARQFPDFEMGELDIAALPDGNPLRSDFDTLFGGAGTAVKSAAAQRLTTHFEEMSG
jgi:hypothetical protein